MQDFFGLIGSICFALGSWPQAFLSWRTKTAKGVNWSFILLWLSGSFFSSIYAVATEKYVLLLNYISGGIGMAIVFFIKAKEAQKIKDNK